MYVFLLCLTNHVNYMATFAKSAVDKIPLPVHLAITTRANTIYWLRAKILTNSIAIDGFSTISTVIALALTRGRTA